MPGRYVFDTNSVVSAALLRDSVSRRAFDAARYNGTVLVSVDTIEELNDVLRRPGFQKYVAESARLEFLAVLLRESQLVEITEVISVCRDPRDDKFLSLAVSGEATYLVTGDKDLLSLNPFRGIEIVTAANFLEILRSANSDRR